MLSGVMMLRKVLSGVMMRRVMADAQVLYPHVLCMRLSMRRVLLDFVPLPG